MSSGLITSAEDYRSIARFQSAIAMGLLTLGSAVVAAALVAYPPGWLALVACLGCAVVVATWFRPVLGVASVLAPTIIFEQFDFAFFRPVTRAVPFFENISNFTPLGGFAASPLEVLLVVVATLTIGRRVIRRQRFHPNPIAVPVAALAVCLIIWLAYGLIEGGTPSIALWELRGLAYFCLLAFLVPQTVETERDVRLLMWVAIAGVVLKAAQGAWNYAVVLGGDLSEVISVTGHEDAVFIAWMLVLLSALLAYRASVAQRTVLLVSAPVMLFTFIATDRRAAYVALALGLVVMGALVATDRAKRHLLLRVGLPLVLATSFLLLAGWNSDGAIGKPARAVKSISAPESTEDVQSNYYRRAEEVNLIMTIRSSPLLGLGFGRPFQASGILSKIDFSLADYIPHNEIMWLWAKMGTVGFAVFWTMIGSLIAYGGVVFRGARRPYTKAVSGLVTAAIAMQVVVSYVDLQLTFARNMVFLGVLVGVLGRLAAIEEVGRADARL